jgi:uncharacterized membrane protein
VPKARVYLILVIFSWTLRVEAWMAKVQTIYKFKAIHHGYPYMSFFWVPDISLQCNKTKNYITSHRLIDVTVTICDIIFSWTLRAEAWMAKVQTMYKFKAIHHGYPYMLFFWVPDISLQCNKTKNYITSHRLIDVTVTICDIIFSWTLRAEAWMAKVQTIYKFKAIHHGYPYMLFFWVPDIVLQCNETKNNITLWSKFKVNICKQYICKKVNLNGFPPIEWVSTEGKKEKRRKIEERGGSQASLMASIDDY